MSGTVEIVEAAGARCRLYWDAPRWDGRPAVAVGSFDCAGAAEGAALLEHLKTIVRERGIGALIGPMDGDTWRSYRLVTKSDGSPPFPLEPVCGAHDLDAFRAAGFSEIARYFSARLACADIAGAPPFTAPDLSVSAWDGRDPERLIDRFFDFSAGSFSRAAFFKPISREAFFALYAPVVSMIDPQMVLFAHDQDGQLAGFLYGYPGPVSDATGRSAVIKTYASRRPGAGRRLVDAFHQRAVRLGYDTVIHALMREDNASLRNSRRYGAEVFREYALMGVRLDEAPRA